MHKTNENKNKEKEKANLCAQNFSYRNNKTLPVTILIAIQIGSSMV